MSHTGKDFDVKPPAAPLDYAAPPRRSPAAVVTLALGVGSVACVAVPFMFASRGDPPFAFIAICALFAAGAGSAAFSTGRRALRPVGERVSRRDGRFVAIGRPLAGLGIAGGLLLLLAIATAPPLGRSREAANRIFCGSNLRQVGAALSGYHRAFGTRPPDLRSLQMHAALPAEVLLCPSSNSEVAPPGAPFIYPATLSYVILNDGAITGGDENVIVALEPPSSHNGDGGSVLFADRSVRFLTADELATVVRGLIADGRWPFQIDPAPFLAGKRPRR